MPAEPHRAVFLSYASSDAAAAKKICDALRDTGVEVWFDKNELTGGDAWDQKIRRQVRDCALFLPVISAATQARREGYFRLEWKLADDRTHLMAKGTPFLVPVCIDDTKDADALVPDSFMAVQWTRLPGGETPEKFCARMKALLDGESSDVGRGRRTPPSENAPAKPAGFGDPALHKPTRRFPAAAWAIATLVLALIAYLALRPRRTPEEIAQLVAKAQALTANAAAKSAPATPAAATPPPVSVAASPSHEWVAKARALYEPWDFASADDFKLAERLLKEATDLEPTNADAWASLAILSYGQFAFGFDRNDARDDLLRRAADRAVKLAPDSDRAKLALALHYRRSPGNDDETLRLLDELAERQPTDKFILRQLGSVLGATGRHDEALATYDRANALPGGDPIACMNRANKLLDLNRIDEAEAAIDRALALRPDYWFAHIMKPAVLLQFRGQIEPTKAALLRIPARVMRDERVAAVAAYFWYNLRETDKAGDALRYVTQDYVESNVVKTPKALLMGLVHHFAGRNAAAVAEWRVALRVLEQRVALNPNASGDLGDKAMVHALLGERAAAEDALRSCEQLRRLPAGRATGATWTIYAALGREAEVADFFAERLKGKPNDLPLYHAALLRAHPILDPFRQHPRFQALIAEAERMIAMSSENKPPANEPVK